MIHIWLPTYISVGKETACNAGDPGLIPGLGRSPGEENGNPLQCSCLGNVTDSLMGYSPWGHKEPDTTERLHSLHVRGNTGLGEVKQPLQHDLSESPLLQ